MLWRRAAGESLYPLTIITPLTRHPCSPFFSSSKSTSSERHEARKKKKNFYANLKRQEDNKLAELSEKYRDRARERRDGNTGEFQPVDASNAYRAVAPDLKSGIDAAERRKQMIQESKFLGGDMEHTHLVKGLDYALLQKVRSEIVVKEQEEELEMERLADEDQEEDGDEDDDEEDQEEEQAKFKTILGRNVFNIVTAFRSRKIERCDLFAPGRMAYVIDLDDDNGETDIPTTLIRSKADLPPEAQEAQTLLSTNDIVINKLSQILSYLRQGGKGKKNKKRDKDKPLFKEPELPMVGGGGAGGRSSSSNTTSTKKQPPAAPLGDSIYDDIGEYRPSSRRVDRSGGEGASSSSKYKYFDKDEEADREAGVMTGKIKQRDYNSLLY